MPLQATQWEMGYTMLVMLLGHALYTYFFAAVTTLIANTEHISAGFRTLVHRRHTNRWPR